MRALLLVAVALLASACTRQAVVPPVSVTTIGQTPVTGHYVATIQSGGWALMTKTQAMSCGAWSFDTDINVAYADSLRDVLTRWLENVDFTPEILSPEELKHKGYDAQIVVHQGNAESSFALVQRFFSFSASARAEVSLAVIVAIRDDTGLTYQDTVTGRGTGSKDVYSCPSIGQAVGTGAQNAVRNIVRDIVASLRKGLDARQVAAKP